MLYGDHVETVHNLNVTYFKNVLLKRNKINAILNNSNIEHL